VNKLIIRRINKHSPDIYEHQPIDRCQLGFAPRFMIHAPLPRLSTSTNEWTRIINTHTYTYMCPSNIGVPWGAYSRLIFSGLASLARKTKTRDIFLGNSLTAFMNTLGLQPRGSDKGNIIAFKEHFIRCINCTVYHQIEHPRKITELTVIPIIESALFADLASWEWHATIRLSEPFYQEALRSPPIDSGALIVLSPGTLRMDILNFLIVRMYSINKATLISWKQLYSMFASPNLSNKSFRQSFKKSFIQAKTFYPQANAYVTADGLSLAPSPKLIRAKK